MGNRKKVEESPCSKVVTGNSLAVQWLGFGAFTAVGPGLIPGRGTKIPQAAHSAAKK